MSVTHYDADYWFDNIGIIWLGVTGAMHLLPHAFMAQTGTTLHETIPDVSVTHYVADYWFDI